MYTELVLKCRLKPELPAPVDAVLKFLFARGERPAELPDHLFFACERWDLIGRCSSYYHHPEAVSSYTEGRIFSRSDLKNYSNELTLFIDWLKPHLVERRACIGWTWYESMESPVLLYPWGEPKEDYY